MEIVTDANWGQVVDHRPCVVKFWASWCQPCKALEPDFDRLAEEDTGLTFVTADIEKNNNALQQFGIRSVPTILYIHDDKVEPIKGRTYDELRNELPL